MKKIGFIGAGNMGGALATAVAKSENAVPWGKAPGSPLGGG